MEYFRSAEIRYLVSSLFGIDHPEFFRARRQGYNSLPVDLARGVGWRKHFHNQRRGIDWVLIRGQRCPIGLGNIGDIREPVLQIGNRAVRELNRLPLPGRRQWTRAGVQFASAA